MTEDIEIPVIHRAHDPLRLLDLPKAEARVNRTDGIVQFPQELIRIIERPVCENVHLRGFQNANATHALIELVDVADLFPEIFDQNAASDFQALRMIGDADVLVSSFLRGRRHLLDRVGTVA